MIHHETQPCPLCGKKDTIALPADGYAKWKAGALVQDAFPTLTLAQREQLISGSHGACFDKAFPGEAGEMLEILALLPEAVEHPKLSEVGEFVEDAEIMDTQDEVWLIQGSTAICLGHAGPTSMLLAQVHSRSQCEPRNCWLHEPSEHHMRSWDISIRLDKHALVERTCEHGVGHPDPDDMEYQRTKDRDFLAVHGCDGCCVVPEAL